MSKMPTLSIILPAYNEEAGIEAIIDRILARRQSLAAVGIPELELIVVDDGSKDRTSAIVENHQLAKLIRHPTKRGYGAALKSGFQAASGC